MRACLWVALKQCALRADILPPGIFIRGLLLLSGYAYARVCMDFTVLDAPRAARLLLVASFAYLDTAAALALCKRFAPFYSML